MRVVKSEDIHFQNDFEDKLVEDPEYVRTFTNDQNEMYDLLFRYGNHSIKGYKIFDYLLLNLAFNDTIDIFAEDLYENDLFEEYVDSIFSRDDEFLKAYSIVYLESKNIEETYGNSKNLADVFIKDTKYDDAYKLNGLIGLSGIECNRTTIKYIKENVVKILKNNKDFKGIESEEEKKQIIKTYLDTIDECQKDYKTFVLQ